MKQAFLTEKQQGFRKLLINCEQLLGDIDSLSEPVYNELALKRNEC